MAEENLKDREGCMKHHCSTCVAHTCYDNMIMGIQPSLVLSGVHIRRAHSVPILKSLVSLVSSVSPFSGAFSAAYFSILPALSQYSQLGTEKDDCKYL